MMAYWPEVGTLLFSLALWVGWDVLQQRRVEPWQLPAALWPGTVARFLYFIGLPYFSLIFGILTTRLLGLRGIEYLTFIDWASPALAAQLQQAFILILATWLLDSRTLLLTGLATLLLLGLIRLALTRQGVSLDFSAQPAWDTVYEAVHWAFYRALFWSITTDLYLGVVLGSLLVAIEWTIHYKILKLGPPQQQQLLIKAILLILTSTLFFYTPNLWLLLPVHLLMVVVMAGKLRPISAF